MGLKPYIFGGLVTLAAYLYQLKLHDVIFYDLGLGRSYQRIEDFPYTCRRLRHPLLESCEDMILDPESRNLYAACATSIARQQWSPGSVI